MNQLDLAKDDFCFDELFYIQQDDLKTQVQMLNIQNHRLETDSPYDQYQQIFLGLTQWHFRFNYFKMVQKIFYPSGSTSEHSTLQQAANYQHQDKTIRLTDLYSLEDLTIHSNRARVIARLKPQVSQQNKWLQLQNSEILGNWLSRLSTCQWAKTMSWLDARMKNQRITEFLLNNHLNNYVCFYSIMESYLTFYQSIKQSDVGLLQNTI